MPKRSKPSDSSEYADHARPADYRAEVEIWTKRPLNAKWLRFLTERLTFEAQQLPHLETGVRVTVTPKGR